MSELDLHSKKSFLPIIEFSILKRKIAKFRKNQIFERNSALYYFSVTKFPMNTLHLNTKNQFSVIVEFLKLENRYIWKNPDILK